MKLTDLTHPIIPSEAQRKCSIETIGAETVNHNVVRKQDQWYIMTNLSMVSHIGTHIEVPYHILPQGADLASMPAQAFCGQAVHLDLSMVQERVELSLDQVKQAAFHAGGILPDDIVLCKLGYASYYGKEHYSECPYFSTESIEWLLDSGMKMMGVDAGGIELPASEHHVNHTALFMRQVPLIENLANLDQLSSKRFYLTAYPYPIAGVEAFPVRVIAYEAMSFT